MSNSLSFIISEKKPNFYGENIKFSRLTYKAKRIPPDGKYPYISVCSGLFLLQQLIWEYGSIDQICGIDFQRIGYIKENLQRETVGKAGCFDCADQRPAHSGLLRLRSYPVGYYQILGYGIPDY